MTAEQRARAIVRDLASVCKRHGVEIGFSAPEDAALFPPGCDDEIAVFGITAAGWWVSGPDGDATFCVTSDDVREQSHRRRG
jgi:hypothetical protein